MSEKVQILPDFFASVYVSEGSNDVLPEINKPLKHEMPKVLITETMIAKKKIGELDFDKGCGPYHNR